MTVVLQKPILVMAGGTGGHVFPALAVAENLRQQGESVVWLGTRSGIEARVVPAADFAIEWLSVQGLRGKGLVTLIMAPFRLLRACWQALRVLRRVQPKAVLGMGGFVSGPGGLMAWLLDIPLFLHEQNSIIGLTNRILSRLATRNYFAFPDAAKAVPRSECIGNPVRASFDDIGDPATRLQARLGSPLQLLVIGGSLGAAALNRFLPEAIACLDRDQRPLLTVAELGAAGVASLLIPFPYAVDNHQYHNARFLETNKAAQILAEAELSAENLALKLKFFQQNRPVLLEMGINARASFQADATERLSAGILTGARS
jgi:UDP-N-acetylglucosamine--N-acetylmuramyl-(pentapeptide) pyrophosphoryl-undecaprenol N-acetylglucosamine transferase